MSRESIVKNQYDEYAKIYDDLWRSYLKATLDFLENWMQLSGDETILDVACGTGELERKLVAGHPSQNIVGVDISEKMLAAAQNKLKGFENVAFRNGSASNLPFPDNKFDVVVTASAFHYFDDPPKFLAEARRVLKPEGKIIILDWCRDYGVCSACDLFLKVFDPAHRVCYNQRELRGFLTDAGFSVEAEQKTRLRIVWGMMAATAGKRASDTG